MGMGAVRELATVSLVVIDTGTTGNVTLLYVGIVGAIVMVDVIVGTTIFTLVVIT